MVNPCGNDKCNEINSGIDECIKLIVKALNDCGMETIASCCGHGNTNGNIVLRDGRELIIVPDRETARKIERQFPDIHGNAVPNWSPIETAPKDGSYIWLADKISHRVGWWNAACHDPEKDYQNLTSGGWFDSCEIHCDGTSKDLFFRPTHWQRLPALPK